MELYDWQKRAVSTYQGEGTIVAVTGSGKTLAARKIAEKVGGKIIVSAPALSILDQWRFEMYGMPNVEYYSFQTLCKSTAKECDLLIVDESHRSVSPEYIKLYKTVYYENILGLTATPNEKCLEMCGDPIITVGFDEARVAPFTVHFHGIQLNPTEMDEYRRLSYGIAAYYSKEHLTQEDIEIRDAIILKRRRVVYKAEARIPKAIELITTHYDQGDKILVICRRVEQAQELHDLLGWIPSIQYHSGQMDDLDIYRRGDVRLCFSVGMLFTGFSDTDTNVGVIVSTPISKSFHYQSIGRIIRYKPGKEAIVHVILANSTSDFNVLNYRDDYSYTLDNIVPPKVDQFSKEYYEGEVYGFSMGRIWKRKKDKDPKQFGSTRDYLRNDELYRKLRAVKPEGGRFTMGPSGVYTKVNGEIVQVSEEPFHLEPEKARKMSDSDFEKFLGVKLKQKPRTVVPKYETYKYKGGSIELEPNHVSCKWRVHYKDLAESGEEKNKSIARRKAESSITELKGQWG